MANWKSALALLEKLARRRSSTPSAQPQGAVPAELRLPALEERIRQLEEEGAASFEVVSSITQQHSQLAEQHADLAQRANALLKRTDILTWACAALSAAFLGVLALLLIG